MKTERQILKKHFGKYYPKLEKWEFFNHILNAMNEIANIGSVEDMIKTVDQGCGFDEDLFGNKETVQLKVDWKSVIDYLNIQAQKKFKYVNSHKTIIEARIKEGYSIDDFYDVINDRVGEWICNKDMKKYIRPSTLFNASKFDGYLNNREDNNSTGDNNFEYNPTEEAELL